MLEIAIIIAATLALAIILVLILASTKPDHFSVRRSVMVMASAEKIFPLINDFHQWVNWSPWENKDPAMKRTYGGSESGQGAVYAWDGNKNVGSGRMEILDASLPSKIVIKLDFFKPFEGHNIVEFSMLSQSQAAGTATKIEWVMHGPAPFMHRVMQLFMNFDKMIGKDFEVGLANLKRATEK
ncbi:MAG TPA: SRPBCC family protein [Bradyrhizobium sp.]|nr:SRPBCC family protein [Bradyrhizobium sp.]